MKYRGSLAYEKDTFSRVNKKMLQEQRQIRLNKQNLINEALELDLTDFDFE